MTKISKACNAGDHKDCQEAACECPCHLHDPEHNDGKEEAGSRFDAQSLEGGRRGEPASGELLPIAQPPEHDTSEVSAVEGQTAQYDGDANG